MNSVICDNISNNVIEIIFGRLGGLSISRYAVAISCADYTDHRVLMDTRHIRDVPLWYYLFYCMAFPGWDHLIIISVCVNSVSWYFPIPNLRNRRVVDLCQSGLRGQDIRKQAARIERQVTELLFGAISLCCGGMQVTDVTLVQPATMLKTLMTQTNMLAAACQGTDY